MSHSWTEPLAWLSPLLLAYGVSLLAAVWSVLAKRIWSDAQEHRSFSRVELLQTEEAVKELWDACLHEGFFMGNVAFAIWAITTPLEGQAAGREVLAGAILLLILSCALFPFTRAWSSVVRLRVVMGLGALALYVLVRQRLGLAHRRQRRRRISGAARSRHHPLRQGFEPRAA